MMRVNETVIRADTMHGNPNRFQSTYLLSIEIDVLYTRIPILRISSN